MGTYTHTHTHTHALMHTGGQLQKMPTNDWQLHVPLGALCGQAERCACVRSRAYAVGVTVFGHQNNGGTCVMCVHTYRHARMSARAHTRQTDPLAHTGSGYVPRYIDKGCRAKRRRSIGVAVNFCTRGCVGTCYSPARPPFAGPDRDTPSKGRPDSFFSFPII